MQFSSRKRRRTPTVIIVSLIDVLLVVLIFLMISTTFKQAIPMLKLNLPESKAAQPGATETKPLIITIASNAPHFFIESRPVTLEQLQAHLTTVAKRDPKLQVAVRADKRAPFGEVTRVIDAAKIAQVGSLNFYTEKAK